MNAILPPVAQYFTAAYELHVLQSTKETVVYEVFAISFVKGKNTLSSLGVQTKSAKDFRKVLSNGGYKKKTKSQITKETKAAEVEAKAAADAKIAAQNKALPGASKTAPR